MIRIPLPPGFDFAAARDFLAPRAASAMEAVREDRYTRAVRLDGRATVLDVRHDPGGACFAVRTAPTLPAEPVRRLVTRMFDLDADLDTIRAHFGADPLLGPLVKARPNLRVQQIPDLFEGLVRAIVGQQVSVAGARTVVNRIVEALGEPVLEADASSPPSPGLRAFPRPEAVAAEHPERLAAFGLTRAKCKALIGAAEASLDGRLDAERLRAAPAAEAEAALVALPGIGPWTASYLRMRAFGDRDAFPALDLGILRALQALLGNPQLGAPEALRIGERWRPWRAYACFQLWGSLADAPK